ncbi:MAG: succinylglutamate desuccinylase/aspartoacylase family protein [Pseudomonadota bacterium]
MRDFSYPVDLTPPDLTAYRLGNTGIDYVWTFSAPEPGPNAVITAIVHGNELCGAIVLDELLRQNFRPVRGRLTLAFVNVAAFRRFDARHPLTSRYVDEDFNRLWSADVLNGERISAELNRARILRPIADRADYLLDLHSMQHPTEALGLSGPLPKGREFASRIGYPRLIVSDAGHAAGPRLRDYEGFADPESAKNAILVECGQHWATDSVEVARTATMRFLRILGMLSDDAADKVDEWTLPEQKFIEVTEPVTVRTNEFQFTNDYRGMEVVERAGTVIGHDGGTAIETPYDQCVLIMPSRRLSRGATAVRLGRFIEQDSP